MRQFGIHRFAFPDDFAATIRILRSDEGGRSTPAFNGIRWDFAYEAGQPSDVVFMIWPDFIDDQGNSLPVDEPLPFDVELPARMTVINDEFRSQVHREKIVVGTRFNCCEGPRHVAEGRVTKITGLHLARSE